MRKVLILIAIAALAFKATPALAQITFADTFTVTAHLASSSNPALCTAPGTYTAFCPIADTCKCLSATKANLHNGNTIVTIPPGTTTVAVARDNTEATSTPPGCFPAYAYVHYVANAPSSDNALINMFGTLCKPLVAGGPLSFSGGGAIESASFVVGPFLVSLVGWGTVTGTYAPGTTGQNLTLNLAAQASTL